MSKIMAKIYVASSWRNTYYPEVVARLKEAGWMMGAGKRTIVYIPKMEEPELMYKLFDALVGSMEDLLKAIKIVLTSL